MTSYTSTARIRRYKNVEPSHNKQCLHATTETRLKLYIYVLECFKK